MITDHEWNIIAKKAFPNKEVKAPPFLWTKLLARLESEEIRRASTWWLQWRWMSRLTVSVGLLVTLGTFYLVQHSFISLDAALDGRSNQHVALQIANAEESPSDDTTSVIVGLDS